MLFTFPSRYLFTIGLSGVFSLTGWCRWIQTGFHLSRPTQGTTTAQNISFTGLSPYTACLPMQFKFCFVKISWPYNPKLAVTNLVWAFPRSLATTNGIIIIFSSSGYLDVSVPRVCLHCWIIHLQCTGLSHSEICGSHRMCQSPQLIAAYHVLHRL